MATANKKTAAKKTASKKPAARGAKATDTLRPIKTSFTKSGLIQAIADDTGLENKQVKAVFASLEAKMFASVHPKGLGEFTLPGILKVVTKKIAAVKGGKKAINPFTKEPMITKAKAATIRTKVRPLTKLKNAALGG